MFAAYFLQALTQPFIVWYHHVWFLVVVVVVVSCCQQFVVSLLFLLAGPCVLILTLFRAHAGYLHFWSVFVDIVLPVAATEGWNIWF